MWFAKFSSFGELSLRRSYAYVLGHAVGFSHHVCNVRCDGWIGKHHLLDGVSGHPTAHSHREQIDRLIGRGSEQMSAKHTPAVLLHQHLESCSPLPNATRRKPGRGLLVM